MVLKVDDSAKPLLSRPRMVEVLEMARCPHGYRSTGRAFLLPADAPMFDALGETGIKARRLGYLALSKPLFDELWEIVQTSMA